MAWYFEQMNFSGTWSPVKVAAEPVLKRGRIKRADGIGPKIRCVREIRPWHAKLDLDRLAEIYGTVADKEA